MGSVLCTPASLASGRGYASIGKSAVHFASSRCVVEGHGSFVVEFERTHASGCKTSEPSETSNRLTGLDALPVMLAWASYRQTALVS